MSQPPSHSLKRRADSIEYHNHEAVLNQTSTQTVNGPQYFGNVNFYQDAPRDETHDASNGLHKEILASLAFPGMLDRRDNIAHPHHDTCNWILDHQSFIEWERSDRDLLWIKGNPGSGKSTIMAFLHRKLCERQSMENSIHLDFFFTARGSVLQYTPLGMLRSLLNQLLRQSPNFCSTIITSYRAKRNAYGEGLSSWEWQQPELERLFSENVIAVAQHQRVIIFIDALDEAGDEAAKIVARYLHKLNDRAEIAKQNENHPCLKMIIASRHYPIPSTVKGIEIWVEYNNREDIEKFVNDELAATWTDETFDDDDFHHLRSDLLKRAGGNFQWVSLVLPMISDTITDGRSLEESREVLESLPSDLEEIYTHVLQNIIKRQYISESCLLFQWVCFAERPLSTREIGYALATNSATFNDVNLKHNVDQIKRRISSLSGGLIEIVRVEEPDKTGDNLDSGYKHIVQLVHQTVREFLWRRGLDMLMRLKAGFELFPGSQLNDAQDDTIRKCHSTLYWGCLRRLNSVKLQTWAPSIDDLDLLSPEHKLQLTTRFPFLEYSIVYVFEHARKASQLRCGEDQSTNQHRELVMLQNIESCWVNVYYWLSRYSSRRQICLGSSLFHIAAAFDLIDLVVYFARERQLVDIQDSNGKTPLHVASENGHLDVVEVLLQAGIDIDVLTSRGRSPLSLAASEGHMTLVIWLLRKGAAVDIASEDGETSLYLAALGQHSALVKILLDARADVHARGGHYGTTLQAAASRGSHETVQLLLDAGADVNAQGGYYGTALQVAAAYDNKYEIFQLLLNAGADVNAQGGYYGTALQAAAGAGNRLSYKTVELLINAGADMNAQGGKYGTALQAAASRGSHETVQLLLSTGADVNAQGGEYGTALQAAAGTGSYETFELLINTGADVNARGGEYGTALQAAAVRYEGSCERVQLLLNAGADINAQGGKYGTALQAAAAGYHDGSDTVQLLLNAGADVHIQGGKYGTALRAAIQTRNTQVVQLLLNAGADVNTEPEGCGTALQKAAEVVGDYGTVTSLLESGAHVRKQRGENIMASPSAIRRDEASEIFRILLDAGADKGKLDLSSLAKLNQPSTG